MAHPPTQEEKRGNTIPYLSKISRSQKNSAGLQTLTYSSSHQLIDKVSYLLSLRSIYSGFPTTATMGEELEMQVYDLVFDHQYHGRNIKIEDGGRAAQKMKK